MYFVAEREIAQVHQSLLLQHVSHETCGSGGELWMELFWSKANVILLCNTVDILSSCSPCCLLLSQSSSVCLYWWNRLVHFL